MTTSDYQKRIMAYKNGKKTSSTVTSATVDYIGRMQASRAVNRLNELVPKVSAVSERHNSRYFDQNGQALPTQWRADSSAWYDYVNGENAAISKEVTSLTSLLKNYGAYLDEDTRKQAEASLSSIGSLMTGIYDVADQEKTVFSQFADADQYNWTTGWNAKDEKALKDEWDATQHNITLAFMQDDTAVIDAAVKKADYMADYLSALYGDKNLGYMADEYRQNRLIQRSDELDAQIAALTEPNHESAEFTNRYLSGEGVSLDEYNAELDRQKQIQANSAEVSALYKEKAAIDEQIREHNNTSKSGLKKYTAVQYNPDFEEKSKVISANNPTAEQMVEFGNKTNDTTTDAYGVTRDRYGNVVDLQSITRPVVNDEFEFYLSIDPTKREEYIEKGAVDTAYAEVGSILKRGESRLWNFVEEGDIKTYRYLKETKGQAVANDYLKELSIELAERENTQFVEDVKNASVVEKIGMALIAAPLEFVGGIATSPANGIVTLFGGNPVKNPMRNAARVYNEAIVEDLSGGKEGFGWDDIYTAWQSSNTSLLASMVSMAFGDASGTVGTILMSLGAAEDEMHRLYEEGATPWQVSVGGAMAGFIEYATEKWSVEGLIDNLFGGNIVSVKSLIGSWLKQSGIEGAEEFSGTIASTLFDIINRGSRSDLAKSIEQYMGTGMTESDATKAAWGDMFKEAGEAAIQGALSGAMGGAGTSVVGYTSYKNWTNTTAKNLLENQAQYNTFMHNVNEYSQNAKGRVKANLDNALKAVNENKTQKTVANLVDKANVAARQTSAKAIIEMVETKNPFKKARIKSSIRSAEVDVIAGDIKATDELRDRVGKNYAVGTGTTNRNTGEDIEIVDIHRTREKGKPTLVFKLKDGSTIKAEDVSYSSANKAIVAEAIAETGIRADYAMDLFNSVTEESEGAFVAQGIQDAIRSGMINENYAIARKTGYAADLTDAQFKTAYKAGQSLAKDGFNRAQGRASQKMASDVNLTQENGKLVGSFYDGTKMPVSALKNGEGARTLTNALQDGTVSSDDVKNMARNKGYAKREFSFQWKQFPPYDKSFSEANQLATRWAYQEDTQSGDTAYLSCNAHWYLIQMFEDMPSHYMVMERLTTKEYQHRKDRGEYIHELSAKIGNGQEVLSGDGKSKQSAQILRDGNDDNSISLRNRSGDESIHGMGEQSHPGHAKYSLRRVRPDGGSQRRAQGSADPNAQGGQTVKTTESKKADGEPTGLSFVVADDLQNSNLSEEKNSKRDSASARSAVVQALEKQNYGVDESIRTQYLSVVRDLEKARHRLSVAEEELAQAQKNDRRLRADGLKAEVQKLTARIEKDEALLDQLEQTETMSRLISRLSDRTLTNTSKDGTVSSGDVKNMARNSKYMEYFPTSHKNGDTHFWCTMWAQSDLVQSGEYSVVGFGGKYYEIQKHDDADFGYRIIRSLTASQVKRMGGLYSGSNAVSATNKSRGSVYDSARSVKAGYETIQERRTDDYSPVRDRSADDSIHELGDRAHSGDGKNSLRRDRSNVRSQRRAQGSADPNTESGQTVKTTKSKKADREPTGLSVAIQGKGILRATTQAQLNVLESIAKITNTNIEVYASQVVNGRRQFTDRRGKVHYGNAAYTRQGNTIMVDIHAGDYLNGLVLNAVSHELVHYIAEMSPEKFRKLADFVVAKFGEKGMSVTKLIRAKQSKYAAQGEELSFMDAYEEVVADSVESMLSQKTDKIVSDIAEMRKVDADLAKTFVDKVKDLVGKMLNVFRKNKFESNPETEEGKLFAEWSEFSDELSGIFAEAAADAADQAALAARRTDTVSKNKKPADDVAGVKNSLRQFEDGTRFVDVITDQKLFDGLSPVESDRLAVKIIKQRFVGKVIGYENPVFVNGTSAGEYAHSAKWPTADIKEAKMRASTELDNLIAAGANPRNADDGADGHDHDNVTHFSYLDTIFKVGENYYSGVINIKNNNKGRLLGDITKIENITKDIRSSYGKNPKSTFLRDASIGSISETNRKSNPRSQKNSLRNVTNRQIIAQMIRNHIEGQRENAIYGQFLERADELEVKQYQAEELRRQIDKQIKRGNKPRAGMLRGQLRDLKEEIAQLEDQLDGLEQTAEIQDLKRTLTKENTSAKAEVKNMMRNVEPPVVDLSNDNRLTRMIGGRYGSARYNIIRDYILDELKDQPIRMSDGKMATVDRGDAQHIASRGRHDDKVAQIAHIQQIIENAKLVAEEKSTKDRKFDYYWYYETQVKYKGEVLPLYVNLGKAGNGSGYHIYDLTNKLRDTAHRVNDVGRPFGNALKSGISIESISDSAEKSNPSKEKNSLRNVTNRQIIAQMIRDHVEGQRENAIYGQFLERADELEVKQYQAEELRRQIDKQIKRGNKPRAGMLRGQLRDLKEEIAQLEDQLDGLEQTAEIQDLKRTLTKENTPADAGAKNMLRGYAENGRGMYEGNFPKGTPKTEKAEVILNYIQNVWSKKPIRLVLNSNGAERVIYAKFDPTYSSEEGVETDARKLMGGNRHGSSADKRVTLDLADDYYQILSDARYNYSKDEVGKVADTHEDVFQWHYFINDIYFAEHGSTEYVPYRVSINVKERSDGNFVYSFSAEKQNGASPQQTLHAAVSGKNATKRNSVSIDSISNPVEKINPSEEKNSLRNVTNRQIIAQMIRDHVEGRYEKGVYNKFLEHVDELDAKQEKLDAIIKERGELYYTKRTSQTRQRMAQLEEQARQLTAEIDAADRKLTTLEVLKPFRDMVENARKRQKEADDIKEAEKRRERLRRASVDKVVRVMKDINRYIQHNSKEKHIPIDLLKPITEAMNSFNLDWSAGGNRLVKDYLNAVKNAYEEILNDPDPLVSGSYDEEITNMLAGAVDVAGDTSIHDMSQEQLDSVYQLFKTLRARITKANRMSADNIRETIGKLEQNIEKEIRDIGPVRELGTDRGDRGREFVWNELKPIYAFRRIGSPTLMRLFQNLLDGQYQCAMDQKEANAFRLKVDKKYGASKWKLGETHTFKDRNGTEFDLTLGQIFSVYATSRREQGLKHLFGYGIVSSRSVEITKKNKLGRAVKYHVNEQSAHPLDIDSLADIVETLTDDQKSYVEEMQAYLSEVMGAKGNEISLKLYEMKMFGEKNYFPLRTAAWWNAFDPEAGVERKIKSPAWSKQTNKYAKSPIVVEGFADVWSRHVDEMSMYHSMALPVDDITRIMNCRNVNEGGGVGGVRQALEDVFGPAPGQYISTLLRDLNGGIRMNPGADMVSRGVTLAKKAATMLSLSVTIQQSSSVMRAMAYIDAKYFVKSFKSNLNLRKHNRLWEELKNYSGVAIIKEMGGFDAGLGRSAREWLKKKEYEGFAGNIKALITDKAHREDVMGFLPAIMDELAWVQIWNAAKAEIAAITDLTGEDLLKAAGKRFNEIIELTQVYDSTLSRSGHMRAQDTGAKMATAFMAEGTVVTNMLYDAALGVKRGRPGAWKHLARTIGSNIGSMVLNALLKSIITAMRDDDDDKTYLEKYLKALAGNLVDGINPLTYIPILRDVWSIGQGYNVDRMDMAPVSDLAKSIQRAFNDGTTAEEVIDVALAVMSFFGVPLKNLKRDMKGFINSSVAVIVSDRKTTGAGLLNAAKEGWSGKDTSNEDQLYAAYMSGDPVAIQQTRSLYKTESGADSALISALRKNDKRVQQAGQYRFEGNMLKQGKLINEIVAEGHFTQAQVIRAVCAEAEAINEKQKPEKEPYDGTFEEVKNTTDPMSYTNADLKYAMDRGDQTEDIIESIVADKMSDGRTRSQALGDVRSTVIGTYRGKYIEAYASGDKAEMEQIRQILTDTGLWKGSAAVKNVLSNWIKNEEENK